MIQLASMKHGVEARKDQLKPRRSPQQRRSQDTVRALLQASTYILERDGWDGFTTNRVAERAGVSIGSLYQYFPNKLALLDALRRAHVEESRAAMSEALSSPGDPIVALVRAMIAAHRIAPRLHRIFTEELPRHAAHASAECTDDPAILLLARPLFAGHTAPDLALFIAAAAVHAVIHDAVCHRPAVLDHPDFEARVVALARHCIVPR